MREINQPNLKLLWIFRKTWGCTLSQVLRIKSGLTTENFVPPSIWPRLPLDKERLPKSVLVSQRPPKSSRKGLLRVLARPRNIRKVHLLPRRFLETNGLRQICRQGISFHWGILLLAAYINVPGSLSKVLRNRIEAQQLH
jgi:hypothetical protein